MSAVLLNMGGGTFVAANYPAGASPVSVAMADLNGDGKADLAVASGTGVSVLLNNGNGTFGAPASYGSGTNPVSVAAGDLNGDGKIDLAVGGAEPRERASQSRERHLCGGRQLQLCDRPVQRFRADGDRRSERRWPA